MNDNKKRPQSASTANNEISAEEQVTRIRQRAYELYEERGREDGHAEEDWLRAEAEITANKRKKSVAA